MIHLSDISINPDAIAYIDWKHTDNKISTAPFVRIRFRVSISINGDEHEADYLDFPADSEDALKLARSLGR